MVVVIFILPAMLWIFDGVIARTSLDMIKAKVAHRDNSINDVQIGQEKSV